ncbi:hypothetical protein [Paraburkholderia sp. J12]|uniref:hypothetical protein n=1 Tax=Paraburkholderia sp. J12 TaxID=2805432 RepID=UPI002ABE0761|nr:hypothetical protein [Paraburkholderia sp. J12]
MARIQIETGHRNAQTEEYKGRTIEVATGYDAMSDKWPVHIYITRDGSRHKVEGRFLSDTEREAFDFGFATAATEIDNEG